MNNKARSIYKLQAQPFITLINAVVYQHTCWMPRAQTFQLIPTTLSGQATQIKTMNPELNKVPPEYYQFSDLFDKQCSKLLLEHCPYDLTIWMAEDLSPPLGPIYSLSAIELQTLWEFIDENLKTGAIQPSQLPEGALVLFVKKKNRDLKLYVDYLLPTNSLVCNWELSSPLSTC